MRHPITLKLITMAVLCLLFAFGLIFIKDLVNERERYHDTAIDEIKTTHVNEQRLMTPFLQLHTVQGEQLIFADTSRIIGRATVRDDEYRLGIHHAISYQASLEIEQSFDTAILAAAMAADKRIASEQLAQSAAKNPTASQTLPMPSPTLRLIIPVSDLRGTAPTEVTVNGRKYPAKFAKNPTIGVPHLTVELSSLISSFTPINPQHWQMAFTLPVMGVDSLSIIPLGDTVELSLSSNWQEPRFYGEALPITKTLSQDGFSARWQNSFIAQDNQERLNTCLKEGYTCQNISSANLSSTNLSSIATQFVDTGDVYTQTDRTIKYALLLVMVSFGTFFLFEILKGVRIHPVQYSLVAGALLVFYLLLLSFAEQVAFGLAYAIASVACVGLIGWYACYMLRSVKRGLGFSLVLGSLYAGFYALLATKEFNLLMGAVGCFVLIAIVMTVTRHIDWYGMDDDTANEQS
ncbi:MAG: cell envelope integrity protein CreD [Moraxella sp.]|nr:cell envelope integrity protein CreD [Moraxella sp.]